MYILRSIAISLLVLLASTAYAQKETVAKQPQQPRHLSKQEQEAMRRKQIDDSIPFFRGVQVKVDAIGLVQKAVSDYGQYEAGVRVNLKDKYFPVVEFGLGKADHREVTTAISYHTSAPYAKIGMDFNIMKTNTTSIAPTSAPVWLPLPLNMMSTTPLSSTPSTAATIRCTNRA